MPPVLAWDKTGTVRLANQGGAATFGLTIDEIVGMALTDLAGPADEIEHTVADMTAGRVVAVHSRRMARVRGGPDQAVLATSRAIEVDGTPGGVTVFVPEGDTGRLGRDSRRTWADLVPVAIGRTDADWNVEAVSTEVQELIDLASDQVAGRSLLELVATEDADELRNLGRDRDGPRSLPQVQFLLPTGDRVEICVLLGPRPGPLPGMRFALIGRVESYLPQQSDRVAELELRLRRIGAEVRATGLLETAAIPALLDHPELGRLSTRQWEVLSRLVQGERVPTIAERLFLSQSTVRNHLATIFERFGVHSQAELLERLRQPVGG
ncbi:MAG TPA: LuxR C-terminal-related transcriptional regulator [Acidimicrobiales bacterium]|nr:LuxR C-terminal-related transcriptional regulator [Acidimicrobiales bacterium]